MAPINSGGAVFALGYVSLVYKWETPEIYIQNQPMFKQPMYKSIGKKWQEKA